MRIGDWSSDVCSSDLAVAGRHPLGQPCTRGADVEVIEETEQDGVVVRRFDLVVAGETVPGLHWLPAGATGSHPTVCIGHGGFQHKAYGNVPQLALQLARNLGVGVVALDAPEHGDRATDPEAAKKLRASLARSGTGSDKRTGLDPKVLAGMAERARVHVAEWRARRAPPQQDERWAAGPFGWWGVQVGSFPGPPLAPAYERMPA